MERIAGCPNLRDMGGIKVENGYVKPGRLIAQELCGGLRIKILKSLAA